MMRLLQHVQNTFRVSFVEKDGLRILEVYAHIEMTCKEQINYFCSLSV